MLADPAEEVRAAAVAGLVRGGDRASVVRPVAERIGADNFHFIKRQPLTIITSTTQSLENFLRKRGMMDPIRRSILTP